MKSLVKTLCSVVLISCFGFAGSQAGWMENGVRLADQRGAWGAGVVVSDGSSGAIIAYQVCNNDTGHVFVQHVDSLGTLLWGEGGISLSTSIGCQTNLQIASDNAGGAIVTWQDSRSGTNYDIYTQRVNASGAAQWTPDGVSLCTATGDQTNPQIVSDGAGGAIVTWMDYRSGSNYDIYAQRVDASGLLQWTTNGVSICTATGIQSCQLIISDGSAGAIVVWWDQRSGNYGIYAQRVNASGVVQWTADGVFVGRATGPQYYAFSQQIISDGAGGAIVTWDDYRSGSNYDIYAERVDADGTIQWTPGGVPICTAAGDQYVPTITSDGAGGAIIAWTHSDGENSHDDIYTQRVNASGAVQWTADGVPVCTAADDDWNTLIISDGAGGAIVTWMRYESVNSQWDIDVCAQRVDGSGYVQWNTNGVFICKTSAGWYNPTVASDGRRGAIVAWAGADISAQRVNASGAVQWNTHGVLICAATEYEWVPLITSDGSGGAIVAWDKYRGSNSDIYAQRLDASGTPQWTAAGVALCTAPGIQFVRQIISDGAGGAIVVWEDYRSGTSDIYGQRVDASGTVQWTADGVALCTATGDQSSPTITSDGAGGAIVTWNDFRSGSPYRVYAQRVTASGAVQWTTDGVRLCTATRDQTDPAITSDGAGGAIVAWMDGRGGCNIVYGQRVDASGNLLWAAAGVPLCTVTECKQNPAIVSDGSGGAIVSWMDYRSGSAADIYAQRVDALGALQWTPAGVPLCTAAGDQYGYGQQIISDGVGGAIVAWWDYRSGSNVDIYAQRVGSSGSVQWTPDGIPLCTAAGDQYSSAIISDGAGGAIVAWADYRGSSGDIYAQRVDASGTVQWTTNGIPICTATGDRGAPTITFDGAGGAIVAWEDYRCGSLIYAVRVGPFGQTEATAIPKLPVTLYQNHPNPFNPRTVIRFYLPEAQEIVLDVYNVAGQRVARLAEGRTEKGYHEVTWDGRSGSGTVCSSGVYFSRLKAGKSTISRKMVIMR